MHDQIVIPHKIPGLYAVQLIPAQGASGTDTYSLEVSANGVIVVLAKDTPINSIPSGGYTVRSEVDAPIRVFPVAYLRSPYVGQVGVAIQFDGSRSFDPDGTIAKYKWDFGDAAREEGPATNSHVYNGAGVYGVLLTVVDNDGQESSDLQYIAVYDPNAGFVTGGGWIDSPAGADKRPQNETLSGKATFGFVSKYLKGARVPTGNTEFQLKAGDLNFKSTSYEWLVVTGSKYARFKGAGTINGAGAYKFMLWARDGAPDTFRIKIWTEDTLGTETVIYDNGSDQPIGGGSIVVHTDK